MNNYETTKNWLSSSVKNRFNFSNIEMYGAYKLAAGFEAAALELNNAMDTSWTREEYKAWTSLWKEVYAKLTIEVKMAKDFRSTTLIMETNSAVTEDGAVFIVAPANQEIARRLRSVATRLLYMRIASKQFAEMAYHNSKAQAA